MNDSLCRQYSTDCLISVLVENSELAYEDSQAILAAIDKQTAVLNELLNFLKQTSTNIKPQLNTSTPSVQNKPEPYIEQSGREKLSKKLLAAADWITTNDPDAKLSVRQVAQGAGVSIGTAQAAMKLVADERSK